MRHTILRDWAWKVGVVLRSWTCRRAGLEDDVRCTIGLLLKVIKRLLEHHSLRIALAMPFALDAIATDRSLLAALDAPSTASQATGFGALARQASGESIPRGVGVDILGS